MNRKRKLLLLGVTLLGVMFAWSLAATAADATETTPTTKVDYGPPPGPGRVTCEDHGIDPPYQVKVFAIVTLDGVEYPKVETFYGANEPGIAVFEWTDTQRAVLDTPGPHEYSIAYGWYIGTGTTT